MAGDREELVFALCHELGNLLAASRLEAYLLQAGPSPPDRAGVEAAARTISRVAARSGSLLAQIRPLLAPETHTVESLEPIEVLDQLRSGLEEECAARLRVDLKSAAMLPDVSANGESLHHILLTQIFGALEDHEGPIHISAHARGDSVAFRVQPANRYRQEGVALAGSGLTRAVAARVLDHFGGGIEVDAPAAAVSVRVPSVAAAPSSEPDA